MHKCTAGDLAVIVYAYNTVNIGNTVANWIITGNGPRWLGFVGTASTTSLYTSVQLGTLEPTYDLSGALVAEAAPMYLAIPEPSTMGLSICGWGLLLLSFVRRVRA